LAEKKLEDSILLLKSMGGEEMERLKKKALGGEWTWKER
jgi:hypothetical protein